MRLETELLERRLAPSVSIGPATSYSGNGQGGFGGAIGQGSLTLSDNGSTLYGTLAKGPGPFNDALVLYIDSVSGGFADTSSFNDAGDGLRKAISGIDGGGNRSTLSFATGFRPDYAIALKATALENFGGLWQLASGGNNSLVFLSAVNLTPLGTSGAPTYNFSVNLSQLGITPGSGAAFKVAGTYISNTGFRSNEALPGNLTGTQGWSPFTQTAFGAYTTASTSSTVPENTTATKSGTYGGSTTSVSGTGVVDNHNGTWSWNGTGDNGHPYSVTVAGNDSSTATFNEAFSDVAPTVAVTSAPTTVPTNLNASASGTASDFDDNIVSASASEGTVTLGAGATSRTWNYSDPAPLSTGNHNVTITVLNADGTVGTVSFSFTASGLAPTFNSNTGLLSITGTAGNDTAQVSTTSNQSVQVTLNGTVFSSDPASTNYDALLAGATGSSVIQIQFSGAAGSNSLVVSNYDSSCSGTLRISADDDAHTCVALVNTLFNRVGGLLLTCPGNLVVTGPVTTTGTATLSSGGSIDGNGLVTASGVTLNAATGIGVNQAFTFNSPNISAGSTINSVTIIATFSSDVTASSLSTNGDITFTQSGGGNITFGTVSSTGGNITLTASGGNLTVGAPSAVPTSLSKPSAAATSC
jgi:hypothetical protein